MTVYTAILFLFLFMTVLNIIVMPRLGGKTAVQEKKLSVLIPMRNEERNAAAVIQSVCGINWLDLECIILNDGSTDETESIVQEAIKGDGRFTLIQGRTLPDGWVGKVHACHQLSSQAVGDHLLFIDADVRLAPGAVRQAMNLLHSHQAGLLTGFARFPAKPVLAKLLVPMQTFFVFFHLPVLLANYTKWPAATAAHGGFMLFTREAYEASGGHAAVKGSLVEDVHLTREVKRSGHRALIANIAPSVTCTMYETNGEAWEGFLKNSYNGIGRSKMAAALLILFYMIVYIVPFFLLFTGIYGPYVIITLQKLAVDVTSKQVPWLAPFIPVSAAAFVILLITSMLKNTYHWKGRMYGA